MGITLVEQSGTILSRDVCFQNTARNPRCPINGGGKHFLVEFFTLYFQKAAALFWFSQVGNKILFVLWILDRNVYRTLGDFEAVICLFF